MNKDKKKINIPLTGGILKRIAMNSDFCSKAINQTKD